MQVEFAAEVYRWEVRRELWCFVAMPLELSDALRELPAPRRGFGSIPVQVTIEHVTWRTSVFPESSDGRYVLVIKKAVRDRLGITLGDTVDVQLATVGV